MSLFCPAPKTSSSDLLFDVQLVPKHDMIGSSRVKNLQRLILTMCAVSVQSRTQVRNFDVQLVLKHDMIAIDWFISD